MARLLNFGDWVTGRVVDHDGRLVRPARAAKGTVVAMYPHMPKIVGIRGDDGNRVDVRVP